MFLDNSTFLNIACYILAVPFALIMGFFIGDTICVWRSLPSDAGVFHVACITVAGLMLLVILYGGSMLGASIDWKFVLLLGSIGLEIPFINAYLWRHSNETKS